MIKTFTLPINISLNETGFSRVRITDNNQVNFDFIFSLWVCLFIHLTNLIYKFCNCFNFKDFKQKNEFLKFCTKLRENMKV